MHSYKEVLWTVLLDDICARSKHNLAYSEHSINEGGNINIDPLTLKGEDGNTVTTLWMKVQQLRESHKLPRFTHKEIDNLTSPIALQEIENLV